MDPWESPPTQLEPDGSAFDGLLLLIDLQREHLTKIAQHELSFYDKEQDQEYRERARKLRRAFKRLGVEDPLPYRSTHAWWDECSKLASYKERRELLASKLDPVVDQVEDLRDEHEEALPDWGPSGSPTWQTLEARIQELRAEFVTARTLDDFQDVGRRAVEVIIGAVNIVYEPWMTPEGESEPKSGDAKGRFAHILTAVVSGRSNEELRSVVNAAWRLAQDSKHSGNVTRAHALAAAHAAMLIARTLAELSQRAVALRPTPGVPGGWVRASVAVSYATSGDVWDEPEPPPEWDPSEWEPPPGWDPRDDEPKPWEADEPPDAYDPPDWR